VRLSGASNGDYEHIIENASFTLAPAFALDATGVRTSVRDGRTTKITQKVIVKGDTMWGYDGKAWSRSTLTTAQLDKLRTGSDPLEFTALMRSVPGVTRTRPDASGSTRYTAGVRVGDFLRLLPDPAGTTRQLRARMPQSAGVTLNLWANAQDRPTRIGLGAAVPGVQFTGSMTFTSYK
jgi:hypothetical protein